MRITRNLAALCVALGLLLAFGTTAWAVDVDLTVKTSRSTNLATLTYRVGVVEDTIDGADAQTGVTLDLDGLAVGTHTLVTSYGDFQFSVDGAGNLAVATGVPMVATGATLTLQNSQDLPDLEVRMRNATGLTTVSLLPRHSRPYLAGFPYTTAAGSLILMDGADADTAVSIPILGVVPGFRLSFQNNLGVTITLDVSESGAVSQASTSDVTITITSTEPDLLVIENPHDLTDFGIRTTGSTTLSHVGYKFDDYYGPGHFSPTSTSTGSQAEPEGVTARTGSTVHTNIATFELTGLVPNQRVQLRSTFGGEWFTISPTGALVRDTSGLPLAWSEEDGEENVLVIDNWVDIQNFRIRMENPVNAPTVRIVPGLYGWQYGQWVPWNAELMETTGSAATTGLPFSLGGLVPGVGLYVDSDVGRCHFRTDADGGLEVAGWYDFNQTDGVLSTDVDGDVTLTLLNSRELWIKLYAAETPPTSMGTMTYECYLGGAAVDGGPRTARDAADFADGETFHVEYAGPQSLLSATINVYPSAGSTESVVRGLVYIRLHADGTATFTDGWNGPVINDDSPIRGALELEIGGESNVYYVEFVDPPNSAPTVTLEDGENITIVSSAQSTTTLTAYVDDDDDDTLSCSWYVDDVVVAGPSAPTAGESELDLGDLDDLGTGSHTIRVEVSDGMFTASAEIVVTVDNSPPDVAVGGGGVYEIDDDIDVVLTAEVSDYDGDDLTYAWTTADGTVLVSGTVETTSGGSPASVPDWDVATTSLGTGTHVLTLTVEAEDGNAVETPVTVEVADTTGPVLAPVADTQMLWPPNHSMVEVVIAANAYDASGGSVTLDVTVESSEPPEFDGDGNFQPDHEIVSVNQSTGEIELELRAERSGKGDGRVYTVTITATDASDNVSTTTVEVVCPHDKR